LINLGNDVLRMSSKKKYINKQTMNSFLVLNIYRLLKAASMIFLIDYMVLEAVNILSKLFINYNIKLKNQKFINLYKIIFIIYQQQLMQS